LFKLRRWRRFISPALSLPLWLWLLP
jgi:hypothetical protein